MIVMGCVGDIIAGDHPLYWGIGVKNLIEKKHTFVFEYVEKIFSETDVVFGNLETVLSDRGENYSYKNSILRGSSNFVDQLKSAHLNVLNIANNHIQEHGKQALLGTIDLLKRNEINVIGIDDLQPQVITIKDFKLGFLGYSLRPEQYANKAIYSKGDEKEILSDICKAKERADCLIISLHWGEEYASFPSSWQIEFAHNLIKNGATIILGHHPHVLQGIEKYEGGIIAYSLGNFVSDMCQREAKKTIILKLILDNDYVNYEVIPCKINDNYQPVPLMGREKQEFLITFERLSRFSNISQKEYEKLVKNSLKRFRTEYYRFLIKNWHRYPIRNLVGILSDFIRRRLIRKVM